MAEDVVGKTGTEGTQPGPGDSSSPAPSAVPALTQVDLFAQIDKLAKDLHGYKSTTGKQLADTQRQLNAYKAAGTISDDVISRIEAREEWIPDLVAEFNYDADFFEPYADYRSARAAAVKVHGKQAEVVKGLEEQLNALKESVKTNEASKRAGGALPNETGAVAVGGGVEARYREALRNGTALPSSAEIDSLTAKYLRAGA